MRAWTFLILFCALLTFVLAEPKRRRGYKKQADTFRNESTSSKQREQKEAPAPSGDNNANDWDCSGGSSGSSHRNGTCYTTNECHNKGGSPAGNCAAGFGVCCVFFVSNSGTFISQNATYIRNPGFPVSYQESGGVTYTINKCSSEVCFLRLDFESFSLLGTGNTQETDGVDGGGVCRDTFSVSVATNMNVPVICGQNTGQHMYVDLGNRPGDSAQLAFTFDANSANNNNRIWEIKATQIPCGYLAPPNGCLQYHTGLTGRITTFNFIPTNDNHLENQDYAICFRRELGYCCNTYMVCMSDTSSFSLTTMVTGAATGVDCSLDYIEIPAATGPTCRPDDSLPFARSRFCGPFLSTVNGGMTSEKICSCVSPFILRIRTDSLTDQGDETGVNIALSRGACIEFHQVTC